LRKRDGRDDTIGQRSDRIEGIFEEAAGKADEVSRKRDVQNLAAPVMQDAVTNRGALDQNEQPVVFPAFRDDFAIARNRPNGRLEIAEEGDFFGRERNEQGELVCERRRETGLPRVWRLRRHLRSRLSVGRSLGRSLSRVKPTSLGC
jgi:hypothetical protein